MELLDIAKDLPKDSEAHTSGPWQMETEDWSVTLETNEKVHYRLEVTREPGYREREESLWVTFPDGTKFAWHYNRQTGEYYEFEFPGL